MAYDAGTAWLQVVPSFSGVQSAFEKEAEKMGKSLDAALSKGIVQGMAKAGQEAQSNGQKAGTDYAKSFNEAARKGLGDAAKSAIGDFGVKDAGKAGDKAGGAFAESWNNRLDRALRSIGDIKIGADSSEAEVKLAAVKRELEELRSQHIGIDIDEAVAVAKMEDLKLRLRELATNNTSVRVRAEAAEAASELGLILGLEDEVKRNSPDVKVKADGADSVVSTLRDVINTAGIGSSRLLTLIAVGASIGTIIVPAAAAAAVAIGGIGTAAAAAVSGIGVAVLGFSGVSGAVQALDKAQGASGKSAASLEKSQNGVAKSLDGVRSAEASLANTRDQAASSARRAAESVVQAQQEVVDAQRTAKQAQDDLTKAYEDARRAQEDQVFAIRDNSLAQRQANIDIAKSKQELDNLMANPRATQAEREQARITYEQRVLQLDELTTKQKRLTTDKAAADKAGISGSQQVTAAQDKVRQAAENVAKAQQRVADAIQSQKDQARQNAFQIQQGQQAVVSAMRAAENASVSAGVAGGAAMDNLRLAMQNLSPAGQAFARFLYGLKPVFIDLRNVAQEGLLPGVQAAIQRLLPYVGQFRDFIAKVASALAGIFNSAVTALEKPTWKAFFSYLRDTAVPTLQGMFTFAENVARGLAALFLALTPFNQQMGQGLVDLSARFAGWAEALSKSTGYHRFLDYVRTNGPKVVDLLERMAKFIGQLLVAAAPVGAIVLKIFDGLFKGINAIPAGALANIIGLIAILATTMIGLTFVVKTYLVVAGLVKTVKQAWAKAADLATSAQKRFRGEVEASERSTREFGFGLGNINTQTGRATDSTGRLSGALSKLRDTMAAVGRTSLGGIDRVSDAAAAAGSGVKTGAQAAGGAVSSAMQDGVARYTAAITTAQGRISLLARTSEIATGLMSTGMSRVAAAVTTTDGRVSALGKTTELLGKGVGAVTTVMQSGLAKISTSITTADGHISVLGKSTESAATAMENGLARVTTAVTTADGRVGLLSRTAEIVSEAMSTGMARVTTAVTTADGRVSVFARTQEALASAVTKGGDFGASVMEKVRGAASTASTAAGNFATTLGTRLTGAAKSVGTGLMSIVEGLGGPWVLAIAGATAAVSFFVQQSAESKARVDGLKTSLSGLADAFAESDQAGKDFLKSQIQSDPNFRRMIQNSQDLGIGLDVVTDAAHGNTEALDKVNSVYDTNINQLTKYNEILKANNINDPDYLAALLASSEAQKKYGKTLGELIKQRKEEKGGVDGAAKSYKEIGVALGLVDQQVYTASHALTSMNAVMLNAKPTADDLHKAIDMVGNSSLDSGLKLDSYAVLADKVSGAQIDAAQKATLFGDILKGIGESATTEGPAFDALAGTFDSIAVSSLNAHDKIGLLTQAMQQMYGAVQAQDDAAESLVETQDRLGQQIASNSAGFDIHSVKIGVNSGAVVANRNALEAALKATQDVYVQDLANGMQMDQAKTKHDTLTKSILEQIPVTQRNSGAVKELVNHWGGIPPEKKTTVSTPGLDKAIDDLINAHAIDIGLAQNPVWDKGQIQAEVDYLQMMIAGEGGTNRAFKAAGGIIEGYSPSKTADNIPIWATADEFMQPVDSVSYYGLDLMEALRRRAIPRELLTPEALGLLQQVRPARDVYPGDGSSGIRLAMGGLIPGYADGGGITRFTVNIPATGIKPPVSVNDLWKQWNLARNGVWTGPVPDDVKSVQTWLHAQDGKPYIWTSAGPQGYDCSGIVSSVYNMLHGNNPYVHTFSTMDEGRYFTKPGYGLLTAGWTNPGERGPGGDSVGHTRGVLAGLGFESTGDHVRVGHDLTPMSAFAHLATYAGGGAITPWKPLLYDSGGMIQPGWNPPIFNGTGRPEPVLNPSQWGDLSRLATQGTGPSNVNNWYFKDTTLDAGKLRALEDRQAALERVGRAR